MKDFADGDFVVVVGDAAEGLNSVDNIAVRTEQLQRQPLQLLAGERVNFAEL